MQHFHKQAKKKTYCYLTWYLTSNKGLSLSYFQITITSWVSPLSLQHRLVNNIRIRAQNDLFLINFGEWKMCPTWLPGISTYDNSILEDCPANRCSGLGRFGQGHSAGVKEESVPKIRTKNGLKILWTFSHYRDYLFKNQENRLGASLTWVNSPYTRRPIRHFACMGNPI